MPISLYEHPVWQTDPEQTMHPGGLEITEQALAFCDLPPDTRVLDVGCGTGASLSYITSMLGYASYGIDTSAELLSRARKKNPEVLFVQAKGEHLPIANESMNLILSECTLSMFEVHLALSEYGRILKHEGYFILSDLFVRNENGLKDLRQLPPGLCISAAMTQTQIMEEIELCHLKVVAWQDCSEKLKEFPICTLATAAAVDPFDLYIASARAKLGYYFLIARKA